MKKLLMLLIVLALALPAYANDLDILVYKTTMTKPRLAADGIKTAKVRGYLVLEVDADEISNLDNGQESLRPGWQILYVKDGRQKLASSYGSICTMTYFQPGKKKGTMFFDFMWSYYELGTHSGQTHVAAYGRVRRIVIGTGKPKPRIPTKLKGNVEVTGAWKGSCRLTMKLDSKRTKNANKQNKTIDDVVLELENRLERKGYGAEPNEPLGDTNPPAPVLWEVIPWESGSGFEAFANMTAAQAFDPEGAGVEYEFQCVDIPSITSGWTPNREWNDVPIGPAMRGLRFRFRVRDTSPNFNKSAWSTTLPCYPDF